MQWEVVLARPLKRVSMASSVVSRKDHDVDLRKMLLLLFLAGMLSHGVGTPGPELTGEAEELKYPNDSVVKTIKTEDGDVFDCFKINKQPSLSHPLLKGHTIQMAPSSIPNFMNNTTLSNSSVHIKFEGCPIGSVPIQRVPWDKSIKETRSMDVWRAKIKTRKSSYYGAKGMINVWGLPKFSKSKHTAHEIWISNGYFDDANEISAGWMVNPEIFGDYESRLFTWWTVDGAISTGCFNTRCPGFVQVNKDVPVGSRLAPLSSYGGNQQYIDVFILQERDTGNWWFTFNKKPVGYWPGKLFKHLKYGQVVQFGGVASSPWYLRSGPMGSGHLPKEGWGKSCGLTNVQIVDDTYTLRDLLPNEQSSVYDASLCYAVGEYKFIDHDVSYGFLFGGPGLCL